MFANPLPKIMLGIGLVIALPALALVFIAVPQESWEIEHLIAPVLLAFGSFKGALATDTVLRMRDPEAKQHLAEHHGSESALRAWLIYKFTAAGLALCAAAYLAMRLTASP